jgi:hypothetical protein
MKKIIFSKKPSSIYLIAIIAIIFIIAFCFAGCEKYEVSDEINEIIIENDLSIEIKVQTTDNYTIERINSETDEEDFYLQIDVEDAFSLRGESSITSGNKYKLTVTMKNIDADPLIRYSFWKKPITSLRSYTFGGENGNPPSSETQEIHEDWVTYEETFETMEDEDSLMITLICGKGTFLLKEINIEQIE